MNDPITKPTKVTVDVPSLSYTTDGQRFTSALVTTKIRSIVGSESLGLLINVMGNVT